MDYLISTPSQLGLALKSARKTKGLTQAEAATKVGLLPKTISALENHPEACSIESLLKLLSVLDLELTLATKSERLKAPQALQEGW
jgi:HTH-type transcriptional regulator / antitoxin HipB